MVTKTDFQPVFLSLKAILQPFEAALLLKANDAGNYSLNAPFSEKYRKELFFGAATIKKNYVSYYLMPVYIFPDLLEGITPRLRRRMQGKSCFNFSAIDDELLEELKTLTRRGFDRYRQERLG
jgi:hypothetical protein